MLQKCLLFISRQKVFKSFLIFKKLSLHFRCYKHRFFTSRLGYIYKQLKPTGNNQINFLATFESKFILNHGLLQIWSVSRKTTHISSSSPFSAEGNRFSKKKAPWGWEISLILGRMMIRTLGSVLRGEANIKCLDSNFWLTNVFPSKLNIINLKISPKYSGIYLFQRKFNN